MYVACTSVYSLSTATLSCCYSQWLSWSSCALAASLSSFVQLVHCMPDFQEVAHSLITTFYYVRGPPPTLTRNASITFHSSVKWLRRLAKCCICFIIRLLTQRQCHHYASYRCSGVASSGDTNREVCMCTWRLHRVKYLSSSTIAVDSCL